MKRVFGIMAGLMLATVVSLQAEEAKYPGPQEGAPNIYKQIFENEKLRVSEITFNPGDKAPIHTHALDHLVYVIEGGTLTLSYPDGTSKAVTAAAGDALWIPAETHSAENTGSTLFRATVTEVK